MKTLLITLIFFVSFAAKSQTTVTGPIYNSVTWTKANSPYNVVGGGHVVVFDNVTITIEPGVKVIFDPGTTLELRGKLRAIGTVTDSIYFLCAIPDKDWGGIDANFFSTGNTCKVRMDYCYCTNTGIFIQPGTELDSFNYCTFYRNYQVNDDDPYKGLYFNHCLFEENVEAVYGGGDASNVYMNSCSFVANVRGANGGHVDSCVFVNNTEYGAYMYQSVTNSKFYNNNIGILADHHHDTRIDYNDIHHNNVGIKIARMWQDPNIILRNNKICNNTDKNIVYDYTNNVSIANNCWCLTDSTAIRGKITDGYANATSGLLNFMPFTTCTATPLSNCDAPTNLMAGSITKSSLIASWDTVAGAIGYEYKITPYTQLASLWGTFDTHHSVLAQSLQSGTKHTICVRAKCAGPSYSSWVCIVDSTSPNSITALNNETNALDAYPNPVHQELSITIANNSLISNLIITNAVGVVVYNERVSANKVTINTAAWANGLYVIKYLSESGVHQTKLIKE